MSQPPLGVMPEMMHNAPQPTPQPVNYYSDASTTNDLTGGLPINLDSLRDGPPGSKPFYPYSTLIRYVARRMRGGKFYSRNIGRYAIKGSPNQKLLLEDIYYAIESRVRVEFTNPHAPTTDMYFSSPISEMPRQDGRWVSYPHARPSHPLQKHPSLMYMH